MITQEELQKLESNQDPLVQALLESYLEITKSQRIDAYIMLYGLIESWTNEITENEGGFSILRAEDKIFERSLKIAQELPKIIASTEAMVNPEQKEEALIKKGKQKAKTLVLA